MMETVILSRVIDGDTFESEDGRTFRLANINAPEKGIVGEDLSKDYLRTFQNKSLEIENLGKDKYDRSLVRLYSAEYLNLKIVELGMASKFLVEKSELKRFADAEEKAISNERGIWMKSPSFGCVRSHIQAREEIVVFNKICDTDNEGWYVKDESRKIYYFNISFFSIKLHSGKGEQNNTDLFWQSATDIWNNDRDSLYVFDQEGKIIHYHAYGY